MPKNESEPSPGIRKSSRAKKLVNHSLLNDLPKEVVNSFMKNDKSKNEEMPPGYNPSDDSDDEYTPNPKKKGRKNDDSDTDSDEQSKPKASRRSAPISMPRFNSKFQSSPNTAEPTINSEVLKPVAKPNQIKEEDLTCVVCDESIKVNTNARFHYSVHYYEDNAFLSFIKPKDLKDGKAVDELGRVHKYTCTYEGCTRRKMGYKEICVHLATTHQKLKELMMADTRPGMKDILDILYPSSDNFAQFKVKEEKAKSTPFKVKEEMGKIMHKRINERDMENSEDIDDPGNKVEVPKRRKYESKVKPKPIVKRDRSSLTPRSNKLHHCLICNGPGKSNKDGRNLNFGSGLSSLKYHYSVCVYHMGGFSSYIDHGQGNVKKEEVEEFGTKYRYTCPFPDCSMNNRRTKPIGYKEYAIHCGVWHHQIEKWMGEDNTPGIKEVYETIKQAREEEGIELEDMPPVIAEEMHTCLLCQGEDGDGRHLSFSGDNICSTRYHYAACYFKEGVYQAMYPPGTENTNEEGGPKDLLGKVVRYSCQEKGCSVSRTMGYKEFTIHMSNDHGGLEEVMRKDHREEVRKLVGKIKKKY